jgi:hypothetical protein
VYVLSLNIIKEIGNGYSELNEKVDFIHFHMVLIHGEHSDKIKDTAQIIG